MSIELRLLHAVLDKEVYNEVSDVFTPSAFSDELEDVAECIVDLHSELEGDLDVDIVRQGMFDLKVLSTAKKQVLGSVLEKLQEAESVDVDAARKFVYSLSRKAQRLKALNKLAQIIEKNEDSHAEVVSILDTLPVEEASESEIVPLDLSSLNEHISANGKFLSSIPPIRANIGGYARGNLVIYFGRPEVGKSSSVAWEVAGWLRQGFIVDYYGNEEPGRKIALNIRRAFTGETDEMIAQAATSGDNTDWPTVQDKLRVRQVGDIAIETIIQRAQKDRPDIIILDQLDKMSLEGRYNNTADRLKALYERARVLAKSCDCLVVAVSQASADAEGKTIVTYADLENSKTGKAGEADVIVGIGRRGEVSSERTQLRAITVSKNKVNGWLDSKSVMFDRHANQWSGT